LYKEERRKTLEDLEGNNVDENELSILDDWEY
jgi:hypothetical protein